MRRQGLRVLGVMFCAAIATPAAAQHEGVRWQQDLEAAKTLARQTGRLVLVHFWTPECAPCQTLEQTVFNQPGVGGAIEARFVPVKLDANANPATAQGFGITRVPTDVIITPDGQVVGMLVSPPTPAAYVAEISQIANRQGATGGGAFAQFAASAPAPPQLNAAYANLPLPANTQPALQPVAQQATSSATQPVVPPLATAPFAPPQTTFNQHVQSPETNVPQSPFAQPPAVPAGVEAPAAEHSLVQSPAAAPSQMANPYAPPLAPSAATPTPPTTPIAAPTAPPSLPSVTAASPSLPNASASAVVPLSAAPDPKNLPPGAPPLGFDGYCPVSMRNHWKWLPGDPRWGIVHRGRTYWFASQTEQQQFWSDPDRYSPALSGMDVVLAVDHQQQVPGKREHSIDYDNLFYLFSSEATLQQFTANPERYAAGVRQAMGIQRGRLVK
jgi:YHS domain-containing protein/thiol-disulfide isomerase/thioredoxin